MRILAIGDTDSLAETRRVLSRSEFEMHRVPAALAAVLMVRRIPFDLMIVVHPIADTDFAGFHREIRAHGSPCRDSQLLVLAPRSRLEELADFHRDARLEVLAVDQPQHLLAQAAARYLGPIRAAPRHDLHLPVFWGAGGRRSLTEDISASGALIALATGARPPIGERLDLTVALPEEPLDLRAQVVRPTTLPTDKARGFAVTWIRPGDADLERLEALLAATD